MRKLVLNRFSEDGSWKAIEVRKDENGVWFEVRSGKKGDKNVNRIILKLSAQEIAYISEWMRRVFDELYVEGEKQ